MSCSAIDCWKAGRKGLQIETVTDQSRCLDKRTRWNYIQTSRQSSVGTNMIKHAQLKKCHFFLLPWVFQFANRSMRPLESLFSFPASTQDTKPTKDPSSAPPGTSRSLLISGWYLLPSFSWWFYSRYIHWIPAPPKKSHDFGLQKTSQIPALLARALGVSGTSKPLAIKAQSSAAQHAANLLDARWADRTMDWKNLATKKKLVSPCYIHLQ